MNQPQVVALFIGGTEGGPIEERSEVTAVAGKGLEGDRYFAVVEDGTRDASLEITLFEAEAVDEGNVYAALDLVPSDMRRNVMTRGIHLRDLIGRTFKVGEVTLEGLADNPPCRRLQRLTGKPLLKPLIDRGGIRGRIVKSGTIRTGDPILPE